MLSSKPPVLAGGLILDLQLGASNPAAAVEKGVGGRGAVVSAVQARLRTATTVNFHCLPLDIRLRQRSSPAIT